MVSRQSALNRIETYLQNGAFLDELGRMVAVETESQEPAKRAELLRYLDEVIAPTLAEIGFNTRIRGPRSVLARSGFQFYRPDARTIMLGHVVGPRFTHREL